MVDEFSKFAGCQPADGDQPLHDVINEVTTLYRGPRMEPIVSWTKTSRPHPRPEQPAVMVNLLDNAIQAMQQRGGWALD
jgi:nitrogen fixation/metabolism regulation signal transduction histidine kinase